MRVVLFRQCSVQVFDGLLFVDIGFAIDFAQLMQGLFRMVGESEMLLQVEWFSVRGSILSRDRQLVLRRRRLLRRLVRLGSV